LFETQEIHHATQKGNRQNRRWQHAKYYGHANQTVTINKNNKTHRKEI
jgi:hypothetical protein